MSSRTQRISEQIGDRKIKKFKKKQKRKVEKRLKKKTMRKNCIKKRERTTTAREAGERKVRNEGSVDFCMRKLNVREMNNPWQWKKRVSKLLFATNFSTDLILRKRSIS